MSPGTHRARPRGARSVARAVVLLARDRRVVGSVLVAWVGGGALWCVAAVMDSAGAARACGQLVVALAVAAAGHGLAGSDLDLDRAGALPWRSVRALHAASIVALAFCLVLASHVGGQGLGPLAEAGRNAVGSGGVLTIGAVTLGANRAWIGPVVWLGSAPRIAYELFPVSPPWWGQALTWSAQPGGSTAALLTAVALGVTGVVAYTVRGPRQ
ncbi:hypothetical protein [Georgenia alba]|uniref:Uncharacterized protein n=1 Tax=Georgenia alba TaxID=2233858 RepID=A0ABW2Q8S1_9MICO